jgi:hypothetical protein
MPVEAKLSDLKVGARLRLTVREPQDCRNARADYDRNYQPVVYIGEVEQSMVDDPLPQISVRWHLPAALGYNTEKGAVSTLVHIANGVWLEARKQARNVAATIEILTEEEYKRLLFEAASGAP